MSGRKKAVVEVAAPTATRADLISEIKRWLEEENEASIETLLTRPIDAMLMAAQVAAKLELIPPGHAMSLTTNLNHLKLHKSIDAVNRVCSTALNGRKNGEFKQRRKRAMV